MYVMLECRDPRCGLRFPAPAAGAAISTCPRCGSPLRPGEPFPAQRVEPAQVQAPGPALEILLDNLRSAFNVGSILRTADGAGVRRAHLCGITPTPDNPKVAKTALSAEFATPWEYATNALARARALQAAGLPVWALEGGPRAVSILEARAELEQVDALALVAGNELAGVDPALLDACDRVISLPMLGFKRSLNVAVAFGIAMYLVRFGERP